MVILLFVFLCCFPVVSHAAVTAEECLGCHEAYKGSAHSELTCTDCHGEVTKIPHAEKLSKPSCSECHDDRVKRFSSSVHGLKGIDCKDCHDVHFLNKGAKQRIDATVCVRCHKETCEAYVNSVHAKKGTISCTECHNPHNIKVYKEQNEKERMAVCSRCHKDYMEKHRWLTNTALHFNYLECTTCHSPRSEKSIVFFFARRDGQKKVPLTFRDFTGILGTGGKIGMLAQIERDRVARSSDIEALFAVLQKGLGRDLLVDASILVTKVYHDHSVKGAAEESCGRCHSEEAPFYGSMYLILPVQQGNLYLPVKGTLLSSYPLQVVLDMVMIGQGKIKQADIDALFRLGAKERGNYVRELGYKWIDLVGLALLLLVLFFVSLHLILRVLIRP